MRCYVFVFVTLHALQIFADEDPQAEARQHFGQGSVLYNEGRYAEAVGEFERARSLLPSPSFDFNIAKSLDRLGRWEAAINAYKVYLSAASGSTNAGEVKSRIDELERRLRTPLSLTVATPAPKPPRNSLRIAAWSIGGAALAVAAVGAGLLGSSAADYRSLRDACSPDCAVSSWAGLPARERTGEALLGVASALVVTDIVLWIVERRRR